MYDNEGNKYTYRTSSYGCIIYKNGKWYMEVADEGEAREIIDELCNNSCVA